MKQDKIRKIRKEGASHVMSVTGLIPTDWQYVSCRITAERKTRLVVVIERK